MKVRRCRRRPAPSILMNLQVVTGNVVGNLQVPVVMLDGEVIVDSSAIISRLAAEKDAEAQPAADRPKAKRGWFSRSANDSSNQAPSTSHTGVLRRAQPASSSEAGPRSSSPKQIFSVHAGIIPMRRPCWMRRLTWC